MSSVSEIDGEITRTNIKDYKIGLIVKDKTIVEKHNYKDEGGNQKILHDKVIEDKLLLDENDIIKGLELFCNNFKDYNYKLDDFIEMINEDYLLSGRHRLNLKLHQKMTFLKFIRTRTRTQTLHLLSHKPRSGKSITILNICKYLLENGTNKILVMTSVPATIKSFTDDLDNYIDFKDIKYKGQDNFKYTEDEFKGIVFCSVQYLKTDVEAKKSYLKKIKFDVMIIDECHMGSSTKKTETDILNANIEDIRNNIKINIFASGTSDKTKKFYKIKNVYYWDIEDEGYMKQLLSDKITENEKNEIKDIMKNRHGDEFIECFNDDTLNKDYSKSPTQVLMKHMMPENIITEINEYNTKNKTSYGYSCNSMFALDKIKNKKTGQYEYENRFELEKSSDGIEILKSFFECVISNDKMKKTTIMKKIEETQSTYKSRISQRNDPKLFLMYLPTHTGNNNIDQLQKTFKRFIEQYKLWINYNIEFSNSIDDSCDYKQEYNTYIKTILDKSKRDKKKGCILLLGNKGGVGITYHDCDVSISLDDGHNLDNQRQRYSRALTEGTNKTIGINVDMNIQRTYLYLNDVIHKHRINTKTTKTNGEILKYLYEHNIFLFNPSDINNGKVKTFVITEYYNKEAENILKNIDDTNLLNEIIVIDDDIILDKDEVGIELNWNETKNKLEPKIINSDLEGEQQDCPKGNITKNYIDNEDDDDEADDEDDNDEDVNEDEKTEEDDLLKNVEKDKIEKQKRILKEVCKRILFPLLALLSRTFYQLDFKEMLYHADTKEIVNGILKDKKIILNKNSYNSIIKIMDNNNEIINNIREIYKTAPANKIHQLIAKHFIPSIEEKKKNAEIPTPLELVNEMLDKIPEEFWKTHKRVLEPCCGKGNFVMKIFEKFYIGLSELYPDVNERCKFIITECLYFGDLTPLNVFITTEILKCEIQSKTGLEDINYTFNSYVGDTLELDINTKFNIDKFDAVIGNPPYEDINATGDNKLYLEFTKYALIQLDNNGLLLFITPRNILEYILLLEKNRKYIDNFYQINYIAIETSNKYFKNVSSTFAYFLIEKKLYYKKTTIEYLYCNKNETIELLLEKGYKIPRVLTKLDIEIINKITSKNNNYILNDFMFENKTQRIRKQHIDKKIITEKETETHKIKIIDTINKTNVFPGKYYYYNNKDNVFNEDKLILSKKGYLMPYVDKTKNYTYSDNFKYIIDNDLDKIKILFESNIVKYLLFQYSKNGFDSVDIIKTLNKKILSNIHNENELYSLYNLSDEEITHIKLLLGLTNINEPKIIKKERSKYYLIDNKLYKIKKDKSQGKFYCDYIDEKNVEVKPKKVSKTKLAS